MSVASVTAPIERMTATTDLPPRSVVLKWLFGRYARRYLRRHFHAVRVRFEDPSVLESRGPLVICVNHASWWDPMVGLVLAESRFGDRRHHAPIAAHALEAYGFLRRLGFFGVEQGTFRGAREFLRAASAVCARPDGALWLTPQGDFRDVRERPTRLREGVGHLLARLERATVLPLAIEYPFWQERTPEALVLAGAPIPVDGGSRRRPREWTALVARRLEETQDSLAELSIARRGEAFETLLGGRAGVGWIYDSWRRLVARVRGRSFHDEHGELDR